MATGNGTPINPSPPIPIDPVVQITIPVSTKLDRNNFLTWKSQIESIINGFGLGKHLDSSFTPPDKNLTIEGVSRPNPAFLAWDKQDRFLLAWLRTSITEGILSQYMACQTARDLWSSLHQVYSVISTARIMELRRALQSTSREGQKKCSNYFEKMKSLADQLAAAGEPVTGSELARLILNGLGSEFNSFAVAPIQHHPHPIQVFHPASPSTAYFAAPPPQFNYFGGCVEHEVVSNTVEPDPTPSQPVAGKEGREGLSDDVIQKITNQVEYYFSDINLATTKHLMGFISKDPDGYVPINIISEFKKIKALIQSNTQLATALRTSSKLVVSDDGKRVKRQLPFTEADMEELQSRIVVAENLPVDHCYQNLMKIFSAVGSVKTIRTCYPQRSNGTTSATNQSAKLDMLFANKVHAFVEYESIEDAEKAITELNDERNWRSGLRVRLLQGCIKPGGVKGKKDGEEEDGSTSSNPPSNEKSPHQLLPDESSPPEPSHDNAIEESSNEKDFGSGGRRGKGGHGRGGKGGGRGSHMALHHHHNNNNNNNHNHHPGTSNNPATPTSSHSPTHAEQAVGAMKQPPGPRMPDDTRGFTMGRGKP